MTIKEFRTKRLAERIPAIAVATKANRNRSWLSLIECGHIQPTPEEMETLASVLQQLITAKAAVQEAAVAVGWPGAEIVR
jgi:hypothetical protein